MAYEKQQVQALADAVVDSILAVRDGGIGADDVDEAINLFQKLAAAADEFKTDTDAAALHLSARMAERFGDMRVGP